MGLSDEDVDKLFALSQDILIADGGYDPAERNLKNIMEIIAKKYSLNIDDLQHEVDSQNVAKLKAMKLDDDEINLLVDLNLNSKL